MPCSSPRPSRQTRPQNRRATLGRAIGAVVCGVWLASAPTPAAATDSLPHRIAHWFTHIGTPTAHARHRRVPPPPRMVFATLPAALESGAIQPAPHAPYALRDWDGTIETLRKHAGDRTPPWAAVQLDATTLAEACAEGLVQVRSPQPGQNLTGLHRCGYDSGQMDVVLAWDRSRLHDTPEAAIDWGAFWDVARHPGKRGLRADPRSTLEIALMSDGVAPQDVYGVLATDDGVSRALRRLDLLRPYIVWWHTPQDAASIMQNGAALMTSAPAAEIVVADAHAPTGRPAPGFVAQWRQSLRDGVFWAIPRGVAPGQATGIATVLRNDAPHYDDSRQAPLTGIPALPVNDDFWQAHLSSLQTRFRAWLGPDAGP